MKPGKDKGVTICLGAKRTLKIGDTMSSVIVPFMPLETDEDFEKLADLIDRMWDFWNDNGMDHERIGEFIARVGLGTFVEGIGLEPDPRMISTTRTSPYIKFEELAPGNELAVKLRSLTGLGVSRTGEYAKAPPEVIAEFLAHSKGL